MSIFRKMEYVYEAESLSPQGAVQKKKCGCYSISDERTTYCHLCVEHMKRHRDARRESWVGFELNFK